MWNRKARGLKAKKLEELSDELFTGDDVHDLFQCMITSQIGQVLAKPDAARAPFTQGHQEELEKLVQKQMKLAIDQRKQAVDIKRQCNVYTPLTRELVATHRKFNSSAVTISSLGAGFTFSLIFQDFAEPPDGTSKEHIKACLAVAWLLFVLTILTASFGIVVQAMQEDHVIHGLFPWRLMDGGLLLAAFVFSAEAVRAYEPAVAIIAFALFGAFAIFVFLFCLNTIMSNRRLKKNVDALKEVAAHALPP